ncbi:MAG: helix-turn-helix domain-containing protein [Gaiellaceae bacterium]
MPGGIALVPRNADLKVGARLRSLRRERGLTIAQVAAATGLTKGFISQLERDTTTPSLSSLARICDALGVRMGDVFHAGGPELVRLIRRNERTAVDWDPHHFLLSPPQERRLQAIESHIPPGEGAGDELYSFPGDVEFVYVLSGSLELRVADERYLLEAGDVLTYPLREPHTWSNPSADEPATVLWVAVPNPYATGV